ncbi:MAG TPA: hypothetical protein VJO33_17590 [Gemmatimonadaceae bacterium]|nr:hypothetical protein [Gemmatimonadaceae bacterium]
MKSEYWKEVERIIDVALENDPSHWQRVLDEESNGDVAVRQEAANLLSRYTAARSFEAIALLRRYEGSDGATTLR